MFRLYKGQRHVIRKQLFDIDGNIFSSIVAASKITETLAKIRI